MRIKNIVAALTALSIAAAPAAAQAQAAPTELAPAPEEVEGSQIRGGFILPTLAIIALIATIVLLTKGEDDPISA